MGTLGGIGEIAREVLGDGSRSSPDAKPAPQKKTGRGAPPALPGVPRVEG